MSRRPEAELSDGQAPVWPEPLLDRIRRGMEAGSERLVVLDDDPTGSQTVHGVSLLLTWDRSVLLEVLADEPVVFMLTNSRSLPEREAIELYEHLGRLLRSVADELGVALRVACRSDSTLRGHFPAEVDAVAEGLGGGVDGQLLVPAFIEGGRLTVGDTHYAVRDGVAVPVGETEFARDATFGFAASSLPQWVEEKSAGRIAATSIVSITLADIREGGPDRVQTMLEVLRGGQVAVVNALEYRDLEVVAAGAQAAEAAGVTLLYRTGASFVRVRGGVDQRGPLEPGELSASGRAAGGLIVCGSHVPMTTRQIEHVLQSDDVVAIEVVVAELLADESRARVVEDVAAAVDDALRAGDDVLVYTSREVITSADRDDLDVGRSVSDALVEIVRRVNETPAFVIAKGGITSHVVADQGLGLRRATVLGQLLPGVSAWRAWDGVPPYPYIVFPGNVGGPDDLLNAIRLTDRIVT